MPRVTSRSPEQFEWSTCGSSEAITAFHERNEIEKYFLIKKNAANCAFTVWPLHDLLNFSSFCVNHTTVQDLKRELKRI